MFCRETVKDVRRASTDLPGYPPPLFFHMGTPAEGEGFFGRFWPEAAAVADGRLVFYRGFGIPRARLGQVLGVRSWIAMLRALLKGNGMGRPRGDVMEMPGALLVSGDRILWRHRFSGPGDRPDWRTIPRMLDPAGADGAPS